jgi:hypothetical protein
MVLPQPRGTVKEYTLRGRKEAGIAGEEAGEGEGVDDRFLQFLDDVVESADVCTAISSHCSPNVQEKEKADPQKKHGYPPAQPPPSGSFARTS